MNPNDKFWVEVTGSEAGAALGVIGHLRSTGSEYALSSPALESFSEKLRQGATAASAAAGSLERVK